MERDEIIRAIARTLFLSAYADGVERGEIIGDRASGGEDWDDVAPSDVDPAATAHAADLVAEFERVSGRTIEQAGEEWERCGGGSTRRYSSADRFGHCFALESMGHGVGLRDDTSDLPDWVDAPYREFSAYDFQSVRVGPVWDWDGETLSRTAEDAATEQADHGTLGGSTVERDGRFLYVNPTDPASAVLELWESGAQVRNDAGEEFDVSDVLPDGFAIHAVGEYWALFVGDSQRGPAFHTLRQAEHFACRIARGEGEESAADLARGAT